MRACLSELSMKFLLHDCMCTELHQILCLSALLILLYEAFNYYSTLTIIKSIHGLFR